MRARLVLAILTTLLEETAIVIIVNWALPMIGINIPLAGLIALMVVWGVYSVTVYRLGSRALRRKQVVGLPDMLGTRGRVVSLSGSDGMVRIKGELWVAETDSGEMQLGEEVVVVGQERLKLVVRASGHSDDSARTE